MPSTPFACKQYGGIALMLGGIFIAVGLLFHPNEADPNFVFDSMWATTHIGIGIGLLLAMYGLIALMHHVTEKISAAANIAIAALIGSFAVLSGLIIFVEGFVFPTLGSNGAYASALSPNGPLLAGDFGTAFLVVLVIFSVSAIATGYYIGTKSIAGITHWSGWLLFGAPIIAFSPPLPYVAFLVGGVALGVGLFVIGKDLKNL